MKHESVAAYLESRRLGRRAESIFVTEMPSSCLKGIVLMDTYSGTPIDHELPNWRKTGFRLVVRAPQYAEGFELAQRALSTLTLQRDTTMPGLIMKSCLPFNDPKPYRRSEAGVWEFEVEFDCTYLLT